MSAPSHRIRNRYEPIEVCRKRPFARIGDRKGTTKKLCDKDFPERSGELSGAICLKTLVLLGNDLVTPSNCSENSLVLFVRYFGFVVLSGS